MRGYDRRLRRTGLPHRNHAPPHGHGCDPAVRPVGRLLALSHRPFTARSEQEDASMVSVLSPDETLTISQKAPQPPAITISGVSVSYPVGKKHRKTILEDLNLKIEEGEFVVLLGETGCGKST